VPAHPHRRARGRGDRVATLCEGGRFLRENRLQALDETGQVLAHRLPHQVQVYVGVLVHDDVERADHLSPGDLEMRGPHVVRHTPRGLTEERDRVDDSEADEAVLADLSLGEPVGELHRSLGGLDHLRDEGAVAIRQHRRPQRS
jgi:hypothetical protein